MKDRKEITNKFNKYFADIIEKLSLKKDTGISSESQGSCRIIKMKFRKKYFFLQSSLKTRLQIQLIFYLQTREVF